MLIDTHAHLDDDTFAADFEEVLGRVAGAGIDRIITIGTSVESSRRAVGLAERHPMIYAVVGIHPTAAEEAPADAAEALRELAAHPRVAAIGETGLDYHRLPGGEAAAGYKRAQAEWFRRQLEIAAERGLNAVIHQRDAWEDTLEIWRPFAGKVRGVFHCFGGTPGQAAEVIALGGLVSFTGIATFKNGSAVRESAASVAADCYMVETDCPYLAPVPYRGKRCEPAYTREVAVAVAQARGITLEQLAADTNATAEKFFRLSSAPSI